MNLITIDFETYYSREYSLSKMTTEEYIRSPFFEVIGVAVKVNDNQTEWASGTHEQLKAWLHTFNWQDSLGLAHNAMFDGAILNWVFDLRPKLWLDTLSMARALHGVEVGGSLKALAERHNAGVKGDEVINAIGLRRIDFSESQLAAYGDYCINDVDITHTLFNRMWVGRSFPKKEIQLIDLTLRMFTEPTLRLDKDLLQQHLDDVRLRKEKLLTDANINKEDLMSNPKFAEVLRSFGVEPPMKESPATGQPTFAFAKNDEDFKALMEHPDERVQAAVAARIGAKSTLEETRTERFIGIAERGLMPVPLKYYAAHTGRWGGSDNLNLQNLPSRGADAGKLKKAILAPEGFKIIDADSSQIEARVLAWLAEQNDLVEAFAKKEDVYKKMASAIYGVPEDQVTKEQRFVGKTTILGAGYGMGAIKFQAQLKTMGAEVELDECRRIIQVYRDTNPQIVYLWQQAQVMLASMVNNEVAPLGRKGVLTVVPRHKAIKLPSGLMMRYDELSYSETDKGLQFAYKTRKGIVKIYGGKVIENVCQAIARCIIGEQMLRISRKYRVVMTVHDAIACVVPEAEVAEGVAFVEECMRWTPEWANGLPINCESGYGDSYGDC
jgi:DNA polymerase I-like protein with 3'-5' exonuclease and polymerase domains